MDVVNTLHARRCSHFRWFPHTLKPPRPLKLPKISNLLFAFFQLLLFRPRLGYGYTSRARGHNKTLESYESEAICPLPSVALQASYLTSKCGATLLAPIGSPTRIPLVRQI